MTSFRQVHCINYSTYCTVYSVWQREFNRLFATLATDGEFAKWNFWTCGQIDKNQSNLELRDWAKVRFSCSQCGNGWTSMRGMIEFNIIFQNIYNTQYIPQPILVPTVQFCLYILCTDSIFRHRRLEIYMQQCLVKNVKSVIQKKLDLKQQCGILEK